MTDLYERYRLSLSQTRTTGPWPIAEIAQAAPTGSLRMSADW